MNRLRFWRIFLHIVFLLLFAIGLNRYFVPFGKLRVSYDFSSKPKKILSELSPLGRVTEREKSLETGETFQRMKGEPVYFEANVPRSFDTVQATVTYKNPGQNILELGVQKGEGYIFDLRSLENQLIDKSDWQKLEEDGYTLLQKEKRFEGVRDFLENFPKDRIIGTYHAPLTYDFHLGDYVSNDQEQIIKKPLRGRVEMYTYIKNEALDFSFDWVDINRVSPAADPFLARVFHGNEEIYQTSEDHILLPDLDEGVYKIILDVNDDIVVQQIRTKQKFLVFARVLYIVDNAEYRNEIPSIDPTATTLYTDTRNFFFKTDHPAGLQNIGIDNTAVEISEVGKLTPHLREVRGKTSLVLPQNDVFMMFDGFASFTEDTFFDPNYGIEDITSHTVPDELDYMIAKDYIPPEKEGPWKIATQTFGLDFVPGDRKHMMFVFSAPGMEEVKEDIVIRKIELAFSKNENLFTRLKKKIYGIF